MNTRNFTKSVMTFAAVAMATLALTATSANAVVVVWDGSTDTNWSADPDTTSWSGGTYNDGDDAQFNGAGAGTVNITGAVSPGSVSVTSGNYTFADGGGSIGGTGGLSKSGAGTLIIQSFNTFTGGVDLSGGTIQVANGPNEAGYLGAASNVLTISGNASFHNQNGTVTLPQGLTINGGIVGVNSGAFGERTQFDGVLAGSGKLVVQGFSANFIAEFRNTANTFTGPIEVQSGDFMTLRMASLVDSANTIGLDSQGGNGGKFEYMSGAIAPLVLNNRQFELIVNGNAATNLSRLPSILSNAAGANTVTVNTDLLVTGTGLKRFVLGGGNAGDNTFAGAIPDAIGTDVLHLYKQNSGKWILSGVNTYEGDTHVDQGNLTLASTGSVLFDIGLNGVNNQILGDAAPGTLTLDGSFAFDLSGADPTIGNMWDIVDSTILGSTTYNPSFNVDLFTDAGGDLWTLNTLGVQFQFDETTGILSTLAAPAATGTPEPSTLILAALGFVGLIGTRRRRR